MTGRALEVPIKRLLRELTPQVIGAVMGRCRVCTTAEPGIAKSTALPAAVRR
jgi:hypothetical protein